MLSLDDPAWNELRHAYGNASDIPELLSTLAASSEPKSGFQAEPWFSLWSSLYHQGDVYTASYAAIPHIVSIATKAVGQIDTSFFQLPTAIEVARCAGRGPDVPDHCLEDYSAAISQLVEAVSMHRNEEWDQSMLLSASAAQAIAKGLPDVAKALLNLDDDWIAKINACGFV